MTVSASGASSASTIAYCPFRGLVSPGGGVMILSYEALTSRAPSAEPSWNFTPRRILNV
jgi:hypothetical protein